MTSITVALPEDRLSRLREAAADLGVTPEQLVQASIEGLLAQPDEEFRRSAQRVLRKNSELYKRLA